MTESNRDALREAGLNAKLPAQYQYGEDALEQVRLGQRIATEAILALPAIALLDEIGDWLEALAKSGDGYKDTGWNDFPDGYAACRHDIADTASQLLTKLQQARGDRG